ncbi:MAG: hypothetical protein ABI591_13865 [Kofleriaceae bacterium]
MQLERPRFRQDLVAEPIEDGHTKFIDVMDPDSGNVFRFYEVEYSLACAMDGERDVPGIMRWAQEELGLSASASEVKTVIATLGDLGYLDGAAARPQETSTPPSAKPSIWDPPAPAPDDMLGRGVVVGQKRHDTPVPDLELGNAGSSASQSHAPAPPASNIELAAGVTTGRSAQQAKPKVEDIALGVPGRVDVSVDLSDQVAVSTKDVKEAVRASKVMNAVEIPDDLKNALDSAGAAPSAKPRKPPPTPAKGMPAVDPKAAEKLVEAAKVADTAKAAAAKAADAAKPTAKADTAKAAAKALPKQVEASKQPGARPAIAPPGPEMKANRGLVVVLIVVAVAAAVFFVYKYVLAKSSTGTEAVMPPVVPVEAPKPAPPPPAESEKLAASAAIQDSVKPVSAGTIEMIAGPNAKVKEGDTLVRFTGAKALDTEISALEKDIDQRVKTELLKAQQERDAAIAAGNKAAETAADAKVADRQNSLDDKQGKLASKKSDRDKLEIKSPAAGTFTTKIKATQKVTPTDEIGTLLRAPTKTVTFKKADAGPKSRVLLVTKDNKKLSCVVTSTDASGVVIECPDDAAADGTEVTFGGVDTSPVPTPDTGSGSATDAGSAAAVPSPAPTRPSPPVRPAPARPAPAHPAQHKAPPVDAADKQPTEPTTTTTTPPPEPPAGSGSAN